MKTYPEHTKGRKISIYSTETSIFNSVDGTDAANLYLTKYR